MRDWEENYGGGWVMVVTAESHFPASVRVTTSEVVAVVEVRHKSYN